MNIHTIDSYNKAAPAFRSVPTATATLTPATADPKRRSITIANAHATATIYWGTSASLTDTALSFPIFPGTTQTLSFDASLPVYLYQATGGTLSIPYVEIGIA